jgi:hypothetical protein
MIVFGCVYKRPKGLILSEFALQFNMIYMSICALFVVRTNMLLTALPAEERLLNQALPFEAVLLPFYRFRKLIERAIRLLRPAA